MASSDNLKMYEVIVLKEGYSVSDGPGLMKAAGTITLLKGPQNIMVDTGNPWDKQLILDGLEKHGLKPEQISFVVCSHGHGDHVGNNNLFTNAVHIVCYDVCVGEQYMLHQFDKGIPYEIDDYVEVVPTPGHTGKDVSVIVRETDKGIVAITGDLFECFEDLREPSLWQDNSERPEDQEANRIGMLQIADYIIPGHGPMFKVPESYKTQMQVVFYEEYTAVTPSGVISETSEYIVYDDVV
ncbi:metallo-beta-lactamase domain-containing protein 1-like [Mytilus californianus]|uniref:metallo-beta-lactamase domain-containing protein 1-like n=1 Tax=Mytilus californianus TaxID=6549 RepID=UPI00224780EE|nr:metallo-beta-lactamase domain-containing protein 1-like [Mytilus californianus]XP_052105791.1 metallo-beta-lactamase domain-containing protein 1-like [Mytilus californianus]XP_052105792.1 metallo-beta-lactamase domain-containing protein 1-like [Mytilus californianus]XP_052105793.1 metallo-beta-lactamase domain-containing protein 1-like [Mytilus californianus]XP_052105794.1 metallo-beta-lactamase domain-containing protein 1-like [Mytilus californianus]XP_052105795.1 metallo-beta-lactamase do